MAKSDYKIFGTTNHEFNRRINILKLFKMCVSQLKI